MAVMDTPKTLNGFNVIQVEQHKNCSTVMVQRSDREFVVATWWPDLKDTWMWGHYHIDYDVKIAHAAARKDFNATASRNTNR